MAILLKLEWLCVVFFTGILVACSEHSYEATAAKSTNKGADSVVDQIGVSPLAWPFGLGPALDPMAAQPQALGGGIWELEEGCLSLSGFPVILPNNDTNWDAETRTLRFLGKDYSVGSEFYVNGGYSNRGSYDQSALLRPLPTTCKGDEVFRAGTQVVSRPAW